MKPIKYKNFVLKIGELLGFATRSEKGIMLRWGKFYFYCAWLKENYAKKEYESLQ